MSTVKGTKTVVKRTTISQLERSVRRMSLRLFSIQEYVKDAMKYTAPGLELGFRYKKLSAAICAVRDLCGPSLVEKGKGSAK